MLAQTFKKTHFLAPVLAIVLGVAPIVGSVSAQDFDDGTRPAASAPAQVSSSVVADARMDAMRDVQSDVSAGGWFAAGFLCGPFGWLFAYMSDSHAPASRLIGRSSDYVLSYSSEYDVKAKNIKTSKSLIGCLVSTVIGTVVQVIIATSVSSTTSSSNNR